jgi:hypothetical protein
MHDLAAEGFPELGEKGFVPFLLAQNSAYYT